jgi:uncharacterized protein YbjT (DUF2867 family)
MSRRRLLITGASGNVGTAIVDALANDSELVAVAAVQSPHQYSQAHDRHARAPDAVRLDFHDASTFKAALDGVDTVFLLRPPAISDVGTTLNRFITVAASMSVRHVVFLSVQGAEKNRIIPHHRVEAHLAKTHIGRTVLRPGFFANNFGDAYRDDIRHDSRVFVPAGDGRVSFVDARDLADAFLHIVRNPEPHLGQGYTLTGSRSYGFADAAVILSRVLNRPIRYEAASLWKYVAHLRARKLPLAQVLVQTVLHANLRRGAGSTVDPTMQRLLGRASRTLEEYLTDYAYLWQL